MRYHKVRGHFKHLTHKKWKNPGWYWWPEHYRGDKNLGQVHKTYEVVVGEKENA